MYVFKILVWDYRKVLHGEFDTFTIKCSIDHETFNKAYKTALNKFDFRLKVCSIYTGNRISENLLLEYKNKYNIDLLPIIKSVNCIYVSESKEYILTMLKIIIFN